MLKIVNRNKKSNTDDEISYMKKINGPCFRVKNSITYQKDNIEYCIDTGTYFILNDYDYSQDHIRFVMEISLIDNQYNLKDITLSDDNINYFDIRDNIEQTEQCIQLSKKLDNKQTEIETLAKNTCEKIEKNSITTLKISSLLGCILCIILGIIIFGFSMTSVIWCGLVGLIFTPAIVLILMGAYMKYKIHTLYDFSITKMNKYDLHDIWYDIRNEYKSSGYKKEQYLIREYLRQELCKLDNNQVQFDTIITPLLNKPEIKQIECKPIESPIGLWIKHNMSDLLLFKTVK